MLQGAREASKVAKDTDTTIEYPSGGTVTLLDILARIMGIEVAYLSKKSSPAELDILRLFPEYAQLFFGPHGLLGRKLIPGTNRNREVRTEAISMQSGDGQADGAYT
ncbi:hypothetical protein FRC10_002755 [Ceratobasidium sp. 414]|nr:hypothetical protein FRC10_002755 [Ceratobasidium sp. 414]